MSDGMRTLQQRVREINRTMTQTQLVIASGSFTDGSFEDYSKPLGFMFGYWEVD